MARSMIGRSRTSTHTIPERVVAVTFLGVLGMMLTACGPSSGRDADAVGRPRATTTSVVDMPIQRECGYLVSAPTGYEEMASSSDAVIVATLAAVNGDAYRTSPSEDDPGGTVYSLASWDLRVDQVVRGNVPDSVSLIVADGLYSPEGRVSGVLPCEVSEIPSESVDHSYLLFLNKTSFCDSCYELQSRYGVLRVEHEVIVGVGGRADLEDNVTKDHPLAHLVGMRPADLA